MKNIQLTQRENDLAITKVMGYLAMAGVIGLFLTPPPNGIDQLPLINGAISLAIALLVWSTFKLIEPLRYSRNWQIAKVIFVPLFWLLLVAAIDLGIYYAIQGDRTQLEEIFAPTLLS